jgi:hypothetical protein
VRTGIQLGLKDGDFFWDFQASPTSIELEPNSITVLDWLMIDNKAETDLIFKYFVEQLYKTSSFLIVFMQLKTDGSWFAENMVSQFPVLTARYLYEAGSDGAKGKWVVENIRDPKVRMKTGVIPCEYRWDTKELVRIEA